jgi:hypothetical protein
MGTVMGGAQSSFFSCKLVERRGREEAKRRGDTLKWRDEMERWWPDRTDVEGRGNYRTIATDVAGKLKIL